METNKLKEYFTKNAKDITSSSDFSTKFIKKLIEKIEMLSLNNILLKEKIRILEDDIKELHEECQNLDGIIQRDEDYQF